MGVFCCWFVWVFCFCSSYSQYKVMFYFSFSPSKLYINGERYDGKTQTLDNQQYSIGWFPPTHTTRHAHAQVLRWGHCQWNSLEDRHSRQEGQKLLAQATCMMLRGRDGGFTQRISKAPYLQAYTWRTTCVFLFLLLSGKAGIFKAKANVWIEQAAHLKYFPHPSTSHKMGIKHSSCFRDCTLPSFCASC